MPLKRPEWDGAERQLSSRLRGQTLHFYPYLWANTHTDRQANTCAQTIQKVRASALADTHRLGCLRRLSKLSAPLPHLLQSLFSSHTHRFALLLFDMTWVFALGKPSVWFACFGSWHAVWHYTSRFGSFAVTSVELIKTKMCVPGGITPAEKKWIWWAYSKYVYTKLLMDCFKWAGWQLVQPRMKGKGLNLHSDGHTCLTPVVLQRGYLLHTFRQNPPQQGVVAD